MTGILVKVIRDKQLFFETILEFYVGRFKCVVLDLYLAKRDNSLCELKKYLIRNWVRQLVFKNYTYYVSDENISNFEQHTNLISVKTWGLLRETDDSLIFNGYGETLITLNNKDSDKEIIDLVNGLKYNGTIEDYTILNDND